MILRESLAYSSDIIDLNNGIAEYFEVVELYEELTAIFVACQILSQLRYSKVSVD